MQQIPPPSPSIGFSLGLFVLLALGLACLAFFAVVTVLLSARDSILPMQKIKSVATTLMWIVPALALVGLFGMRFGVARVSTEYYVGERPQMAQPGVYEEVHSTVRRSSSKPVSPKVPTDARKTQAGVPDIPGIAPIPKISPIDEITPIAEFAAEADQASAGDDTEAARLRRQQQEPNKSKLLLVDKVLKVAETRVGAPDWAEKDPVPSENGTLVSLSSQRFATLPEAEEQLTGLAASYVKEFYKNDYPLAGDWTAPVSVIERHAVRKVVGETLDQDFGNGIRGTMYRAHARLELNSALRKGIHDSWHGQIVTHRLTVLGSMLGLVTLMLATSAGYFRLDDLTGGLYRRRLKFAAASLIAAASLVAMVVA